MARRVPVPSVEGMTKTARVVAVSVVVVVVAAFAAGGYLWWTAPARTVANELRALPLPDTFQLTGEQVHDQGRICVDSCSSASRDYVTELPPREAAEAFAAALRERGFRVEILVCARCDFRGAKPPHERHDRPWTVSGSKGDLTAHGKAGVDRDGQPGLAVSMR